MEDKKRNKNEEDDGFGRKSPQPSKSALSGVAGQYKVVSQFPYGYRNREDKTSLPPGTMIKGSQNVLTNVSGRIGIRKGYTLDGQTNTAITPIVAAYDWERYSRDERHVRATKVTTGANGLHQFRYVATAGDRWDGNVFTEGQVYWIDFMTDLSLTEFNYASFWNSTDLYSQLLFVNGSSNIYSWTGGVTTFASASNSSGVIRTVSVTYGGSGYVSGDILTITGGGGTGGTVSVGTLLDGVVGTVASAPIATGAGYTLGDILTLGGGIGTGATVEVTGVMAGNVTAVTLVARGSGYLTGTVPTTGGTGTGCTVNITAILDDYVSTVTLVSPGTGYSTGTGLATTGGTGTGATIEISATVTGYIEKTGDDTWAEEGFSPTGTVTIDGDEYRYTGGYSTKYITGITPNPTLAGYAAQTVIFQTVVRTPNSAITNLDDSLKNKLISTLNNQVYLTGEDDYRLFLSQVNSFTDFSFSSPRLAGEGAEKTLDSVPAALVPQDSQMYISAGNSSWWITQFTLGADQSQEAFDVLRLKTTALQGSQSQALTTKIKNNICFYSFEPIINSLGLVADVLNFPQTTDLSYSIVNDINDYDPTDGSLFYHKQFLYVALPRNNTVRMYNMTDPTNVYWEAPQILPISRFSVIDGQLYGHSSQVAETYKLFDGYNDNGNASEAVAKFAYNGYGIRALPKNMTEHFQDGYMSSNTTLNLGFEYDIDGCAVQTSFPILGTDTQIVCSFSSQSSLGKTSLGKNPLGGDLLIDSIPLPPYFHVVKTFNPVPFYFESTSFSSTGVDQQWEIISYGGNVTLAAESNNAIKQ